MSVSDAMEVPHQLLCARKLVFTHPVIGENMVLESHMDATI